MIVSVTHNGNSFEADLDNGIDLSVPVSAQSKLNAYHANPVKMEPFQMGNWIGEVAQGAAVNYRNITFNPHGNATHTECVGHIDKTIYSINQHFKQFHCVAQLISVKPIQNHSGDHLINPNQLPPLQGTDAVVIRTLPNDSEKRNRNYSGSNPPYVDVETVKKLVSSGCKHLILDLPSVDREEDGGKLLGHKAFWNYPDAPRMDCTITELAFIPDSITDGLYLLNLQVAPFENDAAPSRPVLFALKAS
ncbi:MAG: cyclase family protein [Flavobacteriales bacterium]|nr:cyclase family protein [Flavobacteriales bacterium]